jgi:Spy/CpxP family protein refolding chaperone
MRIITILAAGVTLAFAVAANAQAQATQPPAEAPATAPEAPGAAQTQIRSVNIVDMTELPEATQTQVNEVVAQGGEASLQQLRTTIDANPEIKSALEAKGLTSANVIAASMGPEGALTLVTKKAG